MRNTVKRFGLFAASILIGAWSAHAFESAHPTVSVAGSFNNWNADAGNLNLVADYIWQGDIEITSSEFEFKFATPGWDIDWGVNTQPHETLPLAGVAHIDHNNIQAQNTTDGTVIRFTFNDQTGRFSVQVLNVLETNLLYNSSFEVQGSEPERARYWEMNHPNVHGAVAGATERAGWDATPPGGGNFFAAILGAWAGQGSGAWWQEAPVEPGVTYEASAWFYAEGAPNPWTAEEQALKLEFWDFSGTNRISEVVLDLSPVTNIWQVQTVSARAPRGAAWGRFVVYADGTGPQGTFRIDLAELKAVRGNREQDFNDWPGAELDGNYIFSGWRMHTGKTVSTVVDGIYTTELARSGLAASLANPTATNTGVYGGYVQSPRLDGGLGTITFYYRHGFTGDPDVGPEDPVSLRVQISEFGTVDWATIATLDNIYNMGHVRYDVPLIDYDSRFVRIQHAGGSTNRLILDDISIAFPEPLDVTRFMNFDTWPPQGESAGCHDYQGWRICTGMVSTAFAKAGYSAQIFGAEGDPNYVRSPQFDNGYGPISFYYRRGTNGLNTVGLVIEASPDGDDWHELDRIEGIFETSWQHYSEYFYSTEPHYIRIRNIEEAEPSEDGIVLLFEPFDGGAQPPPGWTFNQIRSYGPTGSSFQSPPYALRFDRTQGDSFAITPDVSNPTNMQFWIKGNPHLGSMGTSTFNVQGWMNGAWHTITNIYPISTVTAGVNLSFPVSTNMTRFQFQYDKDVGNVAFDDLLITGLPPEDDELPQILMLDEIMIGNPVEYRTQNFNTWPTKSSYAPHFSEYQYWQMEGLHMVHHEEAYEGQSARLRRPTAGPDPTITSHFFRDGIGSIEFLYRQWRSDSGVGFQVQVSSNRTDWVTIGTRSNLTNTEYELFSYFTNAPNMHYVRIVQHESTHNTFNRLLIDNISIPRPQPPPEVSLTGWHEPERPYADEDVTLYAQAIARHGAAGITVTSYYRIGTSGAWTAESMISEDSLYRTTNDIPAQPAHTLVQYYMEATFSGPGGQTGSVYYPADGPADPAFYQIPRNRPGSVWINEIDYIAYYPDDDPFNFEDLDFIELAGVAGSDLTDWRIELVDAGDPALPVKGNYLIVTNTVLSNYMSTGYGFWVLGGTNIPAPPRNMSLTNYLDELLPIGGIRLINELGQIEQAITYGGHGRHFRWIEAEDHDDIFEGPHTNVVAMTGAGTKVWHFSWSETAPPTPGAPNPGQSFGEPAEIAVSPGALGFDYIAGSYSPPPQTLVISNAGLAELTYTLATNRTWISVSPSGGTALQPGETLAHTVSVNTSDRLGNYSGNITVSGTAANSPVNVPVMLTQVQVPNALLRYGFDEGSGDTALNAGTAGEAGHLTLAGNASWTFSAAGVSGAGGDYAVQLSTNTARLHTPAKVADLDQKEQVTIVGWLRTTAEGDDHRLAGNRASNQGFDLMMTSNYSRFGFVASGGGSPEPVLSDAGVFNTNDWVFFAVTYDAADDGPEAVKFYTGSLSNDVTLLSAHPRGALGATGSGTNRFHVGGDGVAAFEGRLDDIRVFTNVVDIMTLQGIRNVSVDRRAGAGDEVPPTITEHPVTQVVELDQSVSFDVVAASDPPPLYQWRFNGTNIPPEVKESSQNPSLFIRNATPAHMGAYDVVVANDLGVVTSQVANLYVRHAPYIIQSPTNRHVYMGMNASLSVVAGGYPPPTYRWRKDGTLLGPTGPNLTISSAALGHNGVFQVMATNALGFAYSDEATIRVLDPNVLDFDDSNALRPGPGGSVVVRWPTAYGRVFDVYWSSNIMDGFESFVPIATDLPATPPMNVYTDTLFGVEREGFYFLKSRPE